MRQLEAQRSYRRLFSNSVWRLASFLAGFLVDVTIAACVFTALILFSWLVGVGRARGIRETDLVLFETTHTWCNFGIFVLIGMATIVRAAKDTFRD